MLQTVGTWRPQLRCWPNWRRLELLITFLTHSALETRQLHGLQMTRYQVRQKTLAVPQVISCTFGALVATFGAMILYHIRQLQVLSDLEKRAVYDRYGEEGLKGQIPTASAGGHGGSDDRGTFAFNPSNAEDIFAEFFGSSPFDFMSFGHGFRSARYGPDSSLFRRPEGMFRSFSESGTSASCAPLRKPPAVESKLPCSLEELYTGSVHQEDEDIIKEGLREHPPGLN